MDLWKFELIIETFGLYVVRSDRFTDTWDSVLPPKWLTKMRHTMCDRPEGGNYTEAEWYEEREIPTNPIHCWNCDDDESAEIWREYTGDSDALVIRSTVGRFKQCFNLTPSDVRIGLVKYGYHNNLDDPKFVVGYWGDNAPITLNPWYIPRYFKRQKYAYEKEIRATIHVSSKHQPIDPGYNLVIGEHGIRTLIEWIGLKPNASADLCKRVQALLNKYGLGDIVVEPSTL